MAKLVSSQTINPIPELIILHFKIQLARTPSHGIPGTWGLVLVAFMLGNVMAEKS
jgi:hypothetical protein